jgi:hypothetical protein
MFVIVASAVLHATGDDATSESHALGFPCERLIALCVVFGFWYASVELIVVCVFGCRSVAMGVSPSAESFVRRKPALQIENDGWSELKRIV